MGRAAALPSHAFETLWSDTTSVLYRGGNGEDVAPVWMLSLLAEYPSPESVKRLEHECSFRDELAPE